MLLSPKITVHFEGADTIPVFAGEKVFITISIQNAAAVESVEWTLNADSMLTGISRNAFSARFEWIPLTAGLIELPRFTARVKNFSGGTETIILQGVMRKIEPARRGQPRQNGTGDNSINQSAADIFLQNAFDAR